jgi:hypothetical protein
MGENILPQEVYNTSHFRSLYVRGPQLSPGGEALEVFYFSLILMKSASLDRKFIGLIMKMEVNK